MDKHVVSIIESYWSLKFTCEKATGAGAAEETCETVQYLRFVASFLQKV